MKSAYVNAATAEATFLKAIKSKQNIFLFDPDKPKEDPNDLLNRVHKGKMLDPRDINHNCPFCNRTMAWDLFLAHGEDCFKRWRAVVYKKRRIVGTVVQ